MTNTLTALINQLSPDKNVKGKQFERLCKWYLQNDPVYSHELKHVWLWKEWPDRWKENEAGIDLVAKHQDGTLWAIQAKAYAEDGSVTKHDMDSFLSESSRPEFSYRLLIATTDALASHAKDVARGSTIPVGVLGRTDLEKAQVNWPVSLSALRAPKLPPKKPTGHWAYQGEAMRNVVKGFTAANRGQMLMACGTGKTLVSLFIREKLAAQRTLVLVPSLVLLKQTLQEWTANAKVDFDFLPVCSDETVTKDDDAILSNTSDLGIPVTTDPEEIAAFLRRLGPRVVFATYQSSPEIAKAFTLGRLPRFDLAIVDEAHRTAGPVSSEFATVLDDKKIPARRRLFMTATPRTFSARVLKTANDLDFEHASMNDEEKYGTVFHQLSFGEAIKRDLLTDYQVAIIGVDNDEYRDWANKGQFVTVDGVQVTDARKVAGQIGVAKAMKQYDLHRMITFHSRIKKAQDFADTLPEVIDWMPKSKRPSGQLWSRHASGEMPTGKRHRLLAHLSVLDEGERGLLANARCLAEGVDVPTLDGIAFIDPRRSEVDIVQATGRAIRRDPKKIVGTIVIPVFIDTDEDPDTALYKSAFKPIWDVLLALRAHDEVLGEQLDALRRQLGKLKKGSPLKMPDKVHVDLPDAVSDEFARAFKVRLVKMTTAPWEEWTGAMERYVEENGHACPPYSYKTANGLKLGMWASNQRTLYARDQLSAERGLQLEKLPGWEWNTREAAWKENYYALRDFHAEKGHARPRAKEMFYGINIGSWAVDQRMRKDDLPAEKIELLEMLDGWEWNTKEGAWDRYLRHLQEFRKRKGHARVPKDYKTADGLALGAWVGQQRQIRKTKGTLSGDREQRLEAVDGWEWDTKEDRWETNYRHLQNYRAQKGHACPGRDEVFDGVKIGSWAQGQRNRKDSLSPERIQRLDAIDGWTWNTKESAWDEGLRYLQDFHKREGHALVRAKYKTADGYPLGQWINIQRTRYGQGKLSPDRIELLEAVDGWEWDARDAVWKKGYSCLREFRKREGHALVRQSYRTDDGFHLGSWVINQRSRKGNLSPERIQLLEAVDGWVWNTRQAG